MMTRLLWLVFVILLILALILAAYFLIRNANERAELQRVAGYLGYEPDARIAQVRRCWDIGARCGQQLFFRADGSQDEIARLVEGLGWSVDRQFSIDGYEIFTKLNLGTRARLTVNGGDGLGDRTGLTPIMGTRWLLTDPAGRSWEVDYYPLAGQDGRIMLNNEPLRHNIMLITLNTR